MLALAERSGLTIAVAHQIRLLPPVLALQQALAGGLIGELLEVTSCGKMDARRAGGEDLVV
jgi:predicted dehydrogenase